MNVVLWIAQLILAGVFVFTGASKVLAYDEMVKAIELRSKGGKIGMTRFQASLVGQAELVGAIAVILPVDIWPPHVFLRLAAAGLALLMVIAGIYHLRRHETAAPSVVLFLLSIFVIVGRWPR
ncbi:MAG: DoxX family protein [Terracidiphilus sp.]|jgi:uncharacterized membrane protein YphA (DoxX/SURF4 family)